ncbi:MAG: hypothetical protein AB7R69_02375 [Candidatus Babeliales bacterium]
MRYSNTTAHRKTPALVKANLLALSRIIPHTFTEQDIIALHDDFLTHGFHYLKVPDVRTGRRMMETFLYSLKNYYLDVACLSMEELPLPAAVADIYETLEWYGYIRHACLESFFLEQWYFDFIWIEATENLLRSPWFCNFSQLLEEFLINDEIPIFIISYY